ncbi:hypothetical protein [Bacillus cereus]|uniref:hypothetical protein n=1 Tax=Bacillus cereus TaxID=1396 RepID=UPI000B4BDD78|nr:hypothetical protein [Bacillus cereus]
MSKMAEFFGGKVDIFSRGSFQMFTFLIMFSVAFTHMYTEKVLLFVMCVLIITINNLGVEYYLIKKQGPNPKDYIGRFLLICLPFAILILIIFYWI